MDITITGRGSGITDRFRRYVEERVAKVEPFAHRPQALEVRVSRHAAKHGPATDHERVELTLLGPGPVVRAEAEGEDKYTAYDAALTRLQEQLRRSRDRRKIHRGRHRPVSLHEAAQNGFSTVGVTAASAELLERVATGQIPVAGEAAEPDYGESPVVIRHKVFEAERLTAEEAVDRMELVGHDFYLFVDATTDRPSVVYRRRGWQYGVLALEAEALLPAVGVRRAAQ